MKFLRLIFLAAIFLIAANSDAQQTGAVAGRGPGAAARVGITVTAIKVKPTCETAPNLVEGDVSRVPEMVFGRSWNDLICVRHVNGKTERLASDVPAGLASPDGAAIAYWNPERHEMHVFLTASRSDVLVESLPGAKLRDLAWFAKGKVLAYLPAWSEGVGIHTYNLATAKRALLKGSFVSLVANPLAENVTAIANDGILRFSLADSTSEIASRVKDATSAEYSPNGRYLGVLSYTTLAEQNAPLADDSAAATDDDGPDCTGGSFALILQDAATKRLVDVPYPKGFDTVLDFSFSPDESAIAVTFGVVGCDYPGERARIFTISLPDLKLTPITPEDRLSVKPVWTPDGKAIVYSDYTGSDSPLVLFDIATGKISRLTNPGQFGPDTWLGWR